MKFATVIAVTLGSWVLWYHLLARLLFQPARPDQALGHRTRKPILLLLSGVLALVGTPALLFGIAWVVRTYLS